MSQALQFQFYRFSRAMDIIEKNDLPKFNISKWNACGVAMMFKFDEKYLEKNNFVQLFSNGQPFYFKDSDPYSGFEALKQYFGITYKEAEYIFGARIIFKSKKNLLSRMQKVMNCYKSAFVDTTHLQFACQIFFCII